MKISKTPVQFANRADMIECNENAFSVCADIPASAIQINLYAPDGTRVITMTQGEAHEFARAILQGENDLSARLADGDYMRALQEKEAAKRAALIESATQTDKVTRMPVDIRGKPVYTVETPDIGTYQVNDGRVWKHLHAGKLRELSWRKSERAITRVCGAVARYEAQPSDAEHIRELNDRARRDRQESGE